MPQQSSSAIVPDMLLFTCRLSGAMILAAALATAARAQQAAAKPQPAFEVASIRPMQWSMDCRTLLPSGSTHFGITCRTLLDLIAMAWHVQGDDIQGGDQSALTNLYAVNATLPDNKTWSDFETIRPMLRQLLIERFHLSVHPSSRKEAGYGLYVAKGGPKLKPSDRNLLQEGEKAGAQPLTWLTVSHVQIRDATMSGIAITFSRVLRQPVADRTGLPGSYNIDLDYAPLAATESTLPSFFSAVEDQLGLHLHPEQVTVPTLVIDHVDASPTPN